MPTADWRESVKQRLLNLSAVRSETFNVLLMRYGVERLARVFREICTPAVEPDGLAFDPVSVIARPIREDAVYDGIRVNVMAMLGKARIPLQVDVGFGDSITPDVFEHHRREHPASGDHGDDDDEARRW